jgi:hypothetical protein
MTDTEKLKELEHETREALRFVGEDPDVLESGGARFALHRITAMAKSDELARMSREAEELREAHADALRANHSTRQAHAALADAVQRLGREVGSSSASPIETLRRIGKSHADRVRAWDEARERNAAWRKAVCSAIERAGARVDQAALPEQMVDRLVRVSERAGSDEAEEEHAGAALTLRDAGVGRPGDSLARLAELAAAELAELRARSTERGCELAFASPVVGIVRGLVARGAASREAEERLARLDEYREATRQNAGASERAKAAEELGRRSRELASLRHQIDCRIREGSGVGCTPKRPCRACLVQSHNELIRTGEIE